MPAEKWFGPLELTRRERADFMKGESWAVFGTLTASGAPVGVPRAFFVDGDDFDENTSVYLAVRQDDPLAGRIRAHPDICMAVDNHEFPTKAVIASGRARLVDDPPPRIVARLGPANQPGAAVTNAAWLAGHAVLELRFDDIVSWDSKKTPSYASAPAVHASSLERNAAPDGPDREKADGWTP